MAPLKTIKYMITAKLYCLLKNNRRQLFFHTDKRELNRVFWQNFNFMSFYKYFVRNEKKKKEIFKCKSF